MAVLLAAAGLLFARTLHTASNYDEGVYLASLDALRHGQRLGSDVFASQPPAWYALLRAGAALAGTSLEAVRGTVLAVSLLGCAGAYALGRSLAGPVAGLAAAALLAAAPTFATQAATVEADPASVALAVCALALAASSRSPLRALLAGALLALALAVKLLVLPFVVPFAALALWRGWSPRAAGAAAAGVGLVVAIFAAVYAGVLGDLWRESVVFQQHGRAHVGLNAHALRHSFDLRTPFAWLVLLGAATTLALGALGRARAAGGALALWTLLPASAAFLLFRADILEHHLALVAPALALPAGVALGGAVATLPRLPLALGAAALALLLAAAYAQEWRRLDRLVRPEPPWITWAADRINADTKPDELVATDIPIVAHLAGRRLPGNLVDTSFARFGARSLTTEEVLRTLDRDHIRVVAIGRAFYGIESIRNGIDRRYRTRTPHQFIVLYTGPRRP